MERLKVKCFGTGDGWPCADRNHSSYLYTFGEQSVLIDCGEPLSRAYVNSGLDYNGFDRIFLSHTHGDHVGGFIMFLQGLWLKKRVKRLQVHLPADAIQPLETMLHACYMFPELFHFRLEFVPLEPGQAVETGTARITPLPTTHLQVLREAYQHKHPQSFEAFSFLLENGGRRVGHTADLGAVEDLDLLLKEPLDLLVCELAHFKPKVLFRYLKGKPVKRVVFVHVASEYWENLTELKKTAGEMLGAMKFSFAKDGQEFTVS